MSAMELKSELKRLIEKEGDLGVLNAILTILQKTSLEPALKNKLTNRAHQSEEDIKTGRLFSIDNVRDQFGK
jgi:hypothetical protein